MLLLKELLIKVKATAFAYIKDIKCAWLIQFLVVNLRLIY